MSAEEQTLGQRLDALARRRAAAHQVRPAWVPLLTVALREAERLGDVTGERFTRTESLPPPAVTVLAGMPVRDSRTTAWARGRPAPPGPVPPDTGPPDVAALAAGPPPDQPEELPPDVRYLLRQAAGAGADLMRVHAGPGADALARVAEADAVTTGADVHVRSGRLAPRRPEGLALLAHEAVHVAALIDPGQVWRRTVGDDQGEEAEARWQERALLGRADTGSPRGPGAGSHLGAPLHAGAGLPPALATGAEAVRPTSAGPGLAAAMPPAGGAAAMSSSATGSAIQRAATDRNTPAPALPDLDSLRRSLVSEVMRQVKIEFERGG